MSAAAAEVATPARQNGAELLARIKPVMRTQRTSLCLRPDLLEAYEKAEEELVALTATEIGSGERLAAGGKKRVTAAMRKKAEEVQALEAQIAETQVWFTLEKMPNPEWKALTGLHPPRKDNIIDHTVGYDRDVVGDEAVRICLVDPVFDTDESWAALLSVLGPSEWNELRECTELVNGKVVHAPKSDLAAALLLVKSARASKSPRAGE